MKNVIPQVPTPKEFRRPTVADREWHIKRLAEVLKAAAHPVRLAIINLLEDDEVSVGALIDQLELSYPTVSHHLSYLRRANIVTTRREGAVVYYWLSDTRLLPLING